MRKFKIYLSFLAVFALLFTSCSKDENSGLNSDSDKATLSFGAILADLANKSTDKQSAIGDMPECTDDTPAYVEIVLMQGDDEVVGTAAEPYRVDLVAGQVFTEEDEALELTPGNYALDHFSVYNADGDLIWLAPRGGALAAFVDNALPIDINLGAGVKKYVDVSVLCYDDRDVNLYGYQFFELDIYEAFEYCLFANYCDEDGRHYPARYSVDVTVDGTTIYSGAVNNVGVNDEGDFYADPLCGALPDLPQFADDEDYIEVTVTLLDWDANYGDAESMVHTLNLSRNDIRANFDGNDRVFYEHLRFGCDDENGNGETPPVDSDNDNIPDEEDECPNQAGPVENNGCPDTDTDGDGVVDRIDQCPGTETGVEVDAVGCPVEGNGNGEGCTDLPGACVIDTEASLPEDCYYASLEPDNDGWIQVNSDTELNLIGGLSDDEDFGDVTIALSGTTVSVTLDGEFSEDRITAYGIEIRPNEDDVMSGTCWESACDPEVAESAQLDPLVETFNGFEYSYPIFVRVDIVSCTTPVGLPD